jgi:cysteinyl-tRNA synthetase
MTPFLSLFNTSKRLKEHFVPINPQHIRIYACGPTVYDTPHIGNARPIIVVDILLRLLRYLYKPDSITYVRNITDLDDKIIQRAAELYPTYDPNERIALLTQETEKKFHDALDALGVLTPETALPSIILEPQATAHLEAMRKLIERLVDYGHAYIAENHILFDVSSFPSYGKLSGQPPESLLSGARIEQAPYKRSPLDFVLWKPSNEGEPGWDSPCNLKGPGRPGWHIECSAMAWTYLGETFDIHAGGIDLIFPHHENEIAQSCACFGTEEFARYWIHNGFLQVNGEKMAKSQGNFITLEDLLFTTRIGGKSWSGNAIRLAMLRTHYRKPIDWTEEILQEAETVLSRWNAQINQEKEINGVDEGLDSRFLAALCDDLNTPQALAILHQISDPLSLKMALNFLGLRQPSQLIYQHAYDETWIIHLIKERSQAREDGQWAEADRLRKELLEKGVKLQDNKDGSTTWSWD